MRANAEAKVLATSRRCAKRCAAAAKEDPGGDGDVRDHLTLLRDAADACQTLARMVDRRSAFAVEMARLVEDVCRSCAESCRAMDGPQAEECAAACDDCVEACQTYVVESTWRDAPVRAPHEGERPIH